MRTLLLNMRCFNGNLFYLPEGNCQQIPTKVIDLTQLFDVLGHAWKATRMVYHKGMMVQQYLAKKEEEKEVRRDRLRWVQDSI